MIDLKEMTGAQAFIIAVLTLITIDLMLVIIKTNIKKEQKEDARKEILHQRNI